MTQVSREPIWVYRNPKQTRGKKNIEVFYIDHKQATLNKLAVLKYSLCSLPGWYWWERHSPLDIARSNPIGPFKTPQKAIDAMREKDQDY